jgi:hypothetical protein
MHMRQAVLRTVVLCAAAASNILAPAAFATELAAHRALYNLTLGSTKGDDVVAATGKMAYEVIDAPIATART